MKRVLLPLSGFALSLALFAGSAWLVQEHILALRDVRETVLPLAAELPPLEDRLRVLTEQVELSELQASLRTGTAEEQLRAYVLPRGDDLPRIVAFFDVLRDALEDRKVLRELSPIDIEDPVPYILPPSGDHTDPLQARRFSFTAVVSPEGAKELLGLLNASGFITVGDALSARNITDLFALTEAENYAGIVAVEQFLSTDLLEYLRNPTPYDARLTQAFPSEAFLTRFRVILDSSSLPVVRTALEGDLGQSLSDQKLWPLPFLVPQTIAVSEEGEGVTVTVTGNVLARKGE